MKNIKIASSTGQGVMILMNRTLRCHSEFHARGIPNRRETRHALRRARWWSLNSTSIEQPSSNFSLFVLLSKSIFDQQSWLSRAFVIKYHHQLIQDTCRRRMYRYRLNAPGCVNAAGKLRKKWQARVETKFTKPGAQKWCVNFLEI